MKRGGNTNHPKKGDRIKVDPIRKIKDIKAISKITQDNPRDHLLFIMGINNGLRPYKGIIHAVGPRMGDGDEQNKIEATIMSCLGIAHAKGWESVAFPAISTGLFMIPKGVCAQAFKNAVSSFWAKCSDTSVKMVWLCLTIEDYPVFERILKSQ
jgi:O-acetyl-ADP-ribose deacetylase (regulator of RNase III)